MKDKKISVNVSAAISAYNRRRGRGTPKMTMWSLGEIVFHDEAISEESGADYLSNWNSGRMNVKKCEPKHLSRIVEATGISLCDILIIS